MTHIRTIYRRTLQGNISQNSNLVYYDECHSVECHSSECRSAKRLGRKQLKVRF
jgi:hypothetical protein